MIVSTGKLGPLQQLPLQSLLAIFSDFQQLNVAIKSYLDAAGFLYSPKDITKNFEVKYGKLMK